MIFLASARVVRLTIDIGITFSTEMYTHAISIDLFDIRVSVDKPVTVGDLAW